MAITNNQRVTRGFELLRDGLGPFVRSCCRAQLGDNWGDILHAKLVKNENDSFAIDDPLFLLRIVNDLWEQCFSQQLSGAHLQAFRFLRESRHEWAHMKTFSSPETIRILDFTALILRAISAPEADEAEKLHKQARNVQVEEEKRAKSRQMTLIEGAEIKGMPAWREIATPHKDVLSGTYSQAEFAADLNQVFKGEATPEYQDPYEFFKRTFLTGGLTDLLAQSTKRLYGEGGYPVVDLQTNFGGGKTHSMLALFHLFGGVDQTQIAGAETILAKSGMSGPPTANRAVLVGTALQVSREVTKPDGTIVRTLWGELAWQLGGPDGYTIVASADETGTSPGTDALTQLFRNHGPVLVLIDEWIAYARQLYGAEGLAAGNFDAHFSFAQSLTEAARAVSDALVVISIPISSRPDDSSDLEIGGEGGRKALDRLKQVIGRMESPWQPANAEEAFEIVRSRLFETFDADAQKMRAAIADKMVEYYNKNKTSFPPDVYRSYEKRIVSTYPIHPSLFDCLYEKWDSLDRFQRTRGLLRLMAAVIHELWEHDDRSPFIMPASVPLDDSHVASELLRYLDDSFKSVVDQDVDGGSSTPSEIDREYASDFGKLSASKRVARTIFMMSAPTLGTPLQGVGDLDIKLGCCLPGDSPNKYGDALRRLTQRSQYLYEQDGRYWYNTQPSVNRLAKDRAAQATASDVTDEIIKRLRAEKGSALFKGVHRAPESSEDVQDEPYARLVILGPDQAHSKGELDSYAMVSAESILETRRGGPRVYRNMLAFLAPDSVRLEELRDATSWFIAWRSIAEDAERLNLDAGQTRSAKESEARASGVLSQRIAETWTWLINPSQKDPEGAIEFEAMQVKSADSLAESASNKLEREQALIPNAGGFVVAEALSKVPGLWRNSDHVPLAELWDDFAKYVYLPRLRDESVFLGAVEKGAASVDWETNFFGFAEHADADGYQGLVAARGGTALRSGVLVKPEAAKRALTAMGAVVPQEEETVVPVEDAGKRSFYGRISLDGATLSSGAQKVSEHVAAHLAKLAGAEVSVTIEVRATTEDAVPDDVMMTVIENARSLGFETLEFEK